MTLVCAKMNGINMAQGVCDLPLAAPLRKSVQAAVEKGFNCYTRFDGIQMLRDAVAEKALKHNDITCDPEKNIIVSAGSTGVFYSVCMALLDAGDEVIVPEPYYGYHVNTLVALGITPKFFRLNSDGWTFDKDKLDRFITPKTKAIIINTPGNPSGKVFSKKELGEIAELAIKHNLFILTDEIYEYFVYGRKKHISPASIPEIKDRTITISGYSKTFSITGWRVGYCICHEKWAETIGHINDLVYVCAPAPLQYAVACGIKAIPEEYYDLIRIKFKAIRDKVCSALNDAGLPPHVPDGAYYILCLRCNESTRQKQQGKSL
jgi:aminotransferase